MFGFNSHYIFAGLVATLCMDVLTGLAIALRLVAPLPPKLMGRWFFSLAKLQPLHADIALASPAAHEIALAVPVHYAIGIALTSMYLLASSRLEFQARSFTPALVFGLLTSVLPWIVMFPAMGYGFFGTRGPGGTHLFVSSLISHVFFGLGLWASTLVINRS